jgi:hypothetical protein
MGCSLSARKRITSTRTTVSLTVPATPFTVRLVSEIMVKDVPPPLATMTRGGGTRKNCATASENLDTVAETSPVTVALDNTNHSK